MDSADKLLALILILAFLISSLIFCSVSVKAESTLAPPAIEWQNYYGNSDNIPKIIQTSDGGYLFIGLGWSHSLGYEPTKLYKIDPYGNLSWSKETGVYDLVQTNYDGYALTQSVVNGLALVKFDKNDRIQWNQTYPIASGEWVQGDWVVTTNEGGYAMAGNKQPLGMFFGAFGGRDVGQWSSLITKTDSSGRSQWTKTYAINGHNNIFAFEIESITSTDDGGLALAGTATMNSQDLNFCLVKISAGGYLQWIKTYGGAKDDEFHSVIQTSDGGFVLAGDSYSFNGVIANSSTMSPPYNFIAGGSQAWLVKTDSSGNIVWNQTYVENETFTTQAHTYKTQANCVIQTSDGGLAFAGTCSDSSDMWLVKTNIQGNVQWQQTFQRILDYGQPSKENGANSLIETRDGSFLIAGFTGEGDGAWTSQFYLVKTTPVLPPPTPSPTPLLTPTSSPTSTITPSQNTSENTFLFGLDWVKLAILVFMGIIVIIATIAAVRVFQRKKSK